MRIYISGPITGVKGYRAAFQDAQDALTRRGHKAENPALHPDGLTRREYMRLDLAQLMTCDAVLMLPGWGKSAGAGIEHDLAYYLEMPVYYRLNEVPDVSEPEF